MQLPKILKKVIHIKFGVVYDAARWEIAIVRLKQQQKL